MIHKKEIEILKLRVNVQQHHIDDGQCRLAFRCMEKVAVAEALIKLGLGKSDADLRVRVDAGHIKFNAVGYRWSADTPAVAKRSLIMFDRKQPVKVHTYLLVARRGVKIPNITRTRQEQINEARRQRLSRGVKRLEYKPLRKRIVGYPG